MANYLAMATLLDVGDEVVIEHPAYGLLVDAASYIGAEVKRFARREENGYAVDPEEVRRAVTPKTRLIVLTNLHNPSSVLTPDAVVREVADIARNVGARLLVDEVYLDAVYENTPRTAFRIGPEVLVTNSLTKVYGLSGLRCGWVLAEPDLARAMYALKNVFGSIGVHPGELLSVAAFENLDAIRELARLVVEADRAALGKFLDATAGVSAVRTKWGTTSFLRLKNGGTEAFLDRLRAEYETSAVPGRFFEMPSHFRVGMGVDSAMFREGLHRMGLALESTIGRR
jgi:aspartate/methionine/tyrosine aminotransferase